MRRLLRRLLPGSGLEPELPLRIGSEDSEAVLEQWARELGVDQQLMRSLVEERRAIVADVAADPRAWGFDLLPARAPRRDVAAELRSRTRVTGALAGSFLLDHEPLLTLVPDPPTLPDGTSLDAHLQHGARLEPEVATAVADHVRSTIQSTLGRALDVDAVEHAVREVAWDHDLDAARVAPLVVRAMREWT